MKKLLMLLMLCLSMMLVFTACGDKQAKNKTEESDEKDSKKSKKSKKDDDEDEDDEEDEDEDEEEEEETKSKKKKKKEADEEAEEEEEETKASKKKDKSFSIEGEWILYAVEADGETYLTEDVNGNNVFDMDMTLEKDGSGYIREAEDGGMEQYDITWELSGNKLSVLMVDDDEEMEGTFDKQKGILTLELEDGEDIYFIKDGANVTDIDAVPVPEGIFSAPAATVDITGTYDVYAMAMDDNTIVDISDGSLIESSIVLKENGQGTMTSYGVEADITYEFDGMFLSIADDTGATMEGMTFGDGILIMYIETDEGDTVATYFAMKGADTTWIGAVSLDEYFDSYLQ